MRRLLYVSTARERLTDVEIEAIIATARKVNASRAVTGLLVFNGVNFMQALEGEEEVIHDLFADIAADKRHHSVVMLLNEHITARSFSGWSMMYAKALRANGDRRKLSQPNGAPAAALPPDLPDHVFQLFTSFNTLS